MERQVLFRQNQEVLPDDLNNAQLFAQQSLDHVVHDAVSASRHYAGLGVSKTAATKVTVDTGRFYASGMVYHRGEPTELDLFNVLPLVTSKIVTIAVYGQTIDTDTQPRDFLIDVDTQAAEPQAVPMERRRRLEITTVVGAESANPQAPAVSASYLAIANVLLDPAGVVAVEMLAADRLPNLATNAQVLALLQRWREQTGIRLDTLASDLSSILARLGGLAAGGELAGLRQRLDRLEAEVRAGESALDFWTDDFPDEDTSDTGHAGYAAVVQDGVRFPDAAGNRDTPGTLSLYNPNDPLVRQNGNMLTPVYDDAVKIDIKGYNAQINLSSYTYTTVETRQLTTSRERVRLGEDKYVPYYYWQSGYSTYDQKTNTFSYNGETFYVPMDELLEVWAGQLNGWDPNRLIRVNAFYVDTVSEPYWQNVTTTQNLVGHKVAQVFLWPADGLLTGVGLYFTQVGASGDVDVMIVECQGDIPDKSRVIARVTLSHDDIEAPTDASGSLPSVVETTVPVPPTLLKGGKKYAVLVNTTGAHWLAVSDDDEDKAVVAARRFRSSDGDALVVADDDYTVKLRVYAARYRQTRCPVEFASFSLSGGVRFIDLLYDKLLPSGTRIEWEFYDNGTWKAFNPNLPHSGSLAAALPSVLRLRALLIGTYDLMPSIGISAKSRCIYGRTDTDLAWYSTERTCSAASTIVVKAYLVGFDDGDHDCTVSLLVGVGETSETADTVSDKDLGNGVVERTATFSGLASVTHYKVKILGNTVADGSTFVVGRIETRVSA